ncbi:hypothetical protein BBJ29_009673 [Phytophthora kernoviae]|uniref:PLAC8 family protein n=1 Tax=Phytophthora kernoviae TaxID=325452 RepID=A0A3F2RDK3_9STRA|nr:hypothetical protein BBJ29_009673 [Phytophthora kernoviae]RLN51868.1 hypothetical protein BBP00_00009801 [Phytophthora kernoviae]
MGDWDVGLFNCFNDLVPNCAMVTFCPFVSVAQTASKLEVMEKMSAKFRLTPYWFALVPSFLIVVAQYVMLALFINQVAVIFSSDSVVWGYIKYKYNHWGEDETWYIYLILTGPYAIQVEDPKTTNNGITTGKWGADFFGCFNDVVPNCCMVYCCPCVSFAQITTRLGTSSYGFTLVTFILLLVLSAFVGIGYLILAIWICQTRGKMRERFQITGSWFGDYCAACCCTCCVLAQMATHVKSYKPGSCEFGPQDTLPAYQQA